MKKRYYVVQQGRQQGPLMYDDLLRVKYNTETYIWTEGMPDWTGVSSIEDFLIKVPSNQGIEDLGRMMHQRQTVLQPTQPTYGATNTGTVMQPPSAHQYARGYEAGEVYHGYQLAPLGHRFAAQMINWVFAFICFTILSKTWADNIALFFTPLLSLATYYFRSGNLGHILLGLKVIQAADGNDLKPVAGGVRELIKSLGNWFILPSIWLLWDDKRQNIYDKIFNTVVVHRKD